MNKTDKANLDNLRLRTKFLRQSVAGVEGAVLGQGGIETALAMYYRLHALTEITEATVRDFRACAMVAPEQQPRLEQAQAKFAEASALLRECYDTEQDKRAEQ